MNAPTGERLAAVRQRIRLAAERAGRDPGEIQLIAVSKRFPADVVADAALAGLDVLGESYIQEARDKIPAVRERIRAAGGAQPRWHLVGRLQRNKVRDAVRWFDCVESVDRTELADALDRRAEAEGRRLEVMLQVGLRGEEQKGGATPEALPALLAHCAGLRHLDVTGLMSVPPASPDPEAARSVFAELRALRDRLQDAPGGEKLRELSMGMSGDFEVAIEEGATRVRIGTALFGPREGDA